MRRDSIKQTETIKLSKKNIFQQNVIVADKYKMIDVSLYPQSDDIYNNFVEDIYGEDTTILVSNNKI